MSLLYSMACDLGERFSLGPVPYGQERYVIPIIGGTFKGPRISGKQWRLFFLYTTTVAETPL